MKFQWNCLIKSILFLSNLTQLTDMNICGQIKKHRYFIIQRYRTCRSRTTKGPVHPPLLMKIENIKF